MLSPRLTNCIECTTIPVLINDIDCKLTLLANSEYNNIVFMLNNVTPGDVISDLLNYKRILTYKYCNPEYAPHYTIQMIASKVKRLTAGCEVPCNCNNGPTPLPGCENKVLVIQICNINQAEDDNFDIYLNNEYIGHIDLTMSGVLNGGMFIGDNSFPLTIVQPDFCCPIDPQIMPTFSFPTHLVQYGINTLKFVRTQNNGNGNYGSIAIRNYTRDGVTLINPCYIDTLFYHGPNPDGYSEYTFDYSQCCYPTPTDPCNWD